MSGSINNVYFVAAPFDCAMLGLYGYATLTLKRSGIHDTLFDDLVVPEKSC
ncbi:hypothetical protein SDC9_166086 [bioreactor metagenome]|uniref:Uncharacterized protein n=1 Tax=bioreactor metagenome TaxID=1076179 RepID=A0A645G3X3_9ZZZZ